MYMAKKSINAQRSLIIAFSDFMAIWTLHFYNTCSIYPRDSYVKYQMMLIIYVYGCFLLQASMRVLRILSKFVVCCIYNLYSSIFLGTGGDVKLSNG